MLQVAADVARTVPPPRAANFHVTKNRNNLYLWQHEKLSRLELVIRATLARILQHKIRCAKGFTINVACVTPTSGGVTLGNVSFDLSRNKIATNFKETISQCNTLQRQISREMCFKI